MRAFSTRSSGMLFLKAVSSSSSSTSHIASSKLAAPSSIICFRQNTPTRASDRIDCFIALCSSAKKSFSKKPTCSRRCTYRRTIEYITSAAVVCRNAFLCSAALPRRIGSSLASGPLISALMLSTPLFIGPSKMVAMKPSYTSFHSFSLKSTFGFWKMAKMRSQQSLRTT